jgi:hypothetical protein
MGQQHDCRWLWEPLSELVAERRTGTLYIKSDDAHAGMVLLSEGEIVSFMYQSKFGAPAVELIQQVSGGTFRFDATGRGLKAGSVRRRERFCTPLLHGAKMPSAGQSRPHGMCTTRPRCGIFWVT